MGIALDHCLPEPEGPLPESEAEERAAALCAEPDGPPEPDDLADEGLDALESLAAAGESNAGELIHPAQAFTDTAAADRFQEAHGDRVRYVQEWGKWLAWTGSHWAPNDALLHQMAEATGKDYWKDVAARLVLDTPNGELRDLKKHAQYLSNRNGISNMLAIARYRPSVNISHTALDTDPTKLNCLNGTVNLWSGSLEPHDPADLITKVCPVEFNMSAKCPIWDGVLDRIMDGQPGLVRYLQQMAGYALTGYTREQCLFILHGTGSNGKSLFLNTMQDIMGDYACQAPEGLLVAKGDSHPTEMATLCGKRLAVSIETEDGRRLAESRVKQLTGCDRISARRMREDFWQFAPTHKLILATNHKPEIRGTDHAMWRRMRLVPFGVQIHDDEQDRNLPAKLRAEYPGILAWAVRGCIDWLKAGRLDTPHAVEKATRVYRTSEDVLGDFLDECCRMQPTFEARAGGLHKAYKAWCAKSGESPTTQRRFGKALSERGFDRHTNNGTVYVGLELNMDHQESWA
jgi:putative DNA primase/helicase